MPIPDAPAASSPTPPPPPAGSAAPPRIVAPPPPPTPHDEEFQPVAAFLAFLLPGLGHFWLGDRARGVMIGVGVLTMFVAGMLIGGIDVVDRKEDTIWFAGQALVGPIAFGADYIHQNHLKVWAPDPSDPRRRVLRSAYPGETRGPGAAVQPAAPGVKPPNTKSLGRMNELGTLFATLAGMLNLIAIIDAAFHARREQEQVLHVLRAQRLDGGRR